ncbi:undecaprenyldiphospho-muramoylpentapeptide beta-N-acetylglucosaminyltransferase [Brumicola pallidula]|uniref:UDP-N-acetylglucosamine--N-acetylmuramyl-(pentapeptide) pyrophosphoryl-undecaprenol N-acetylglucosamine transferase n=1 Tax=Brumicola pallidula DSM 14239 = ACAM 615 TaxID=1121922 RepID=K6ZKM8_9ALTE|nr:undecaprenyldiphospho-muramoylpentapeptide beta-N-acetylglucosaminyltransferase [Glaciecola pallidula]GAC30872.1 UDP-N-acetylglucosamine--N-acetylmuramyl-(pentapeptide) pyrophosphoryl-undecaprenol N-acetylglucosamine transferase [Glaciecola pallidula DSM 14239 = ACAM 615]
MRDVTDVSKVLSANQPLLVIMAGGTGGHVFPGLAVAKEITRQSWRVEWFGSADKMEAELVPKNGFVIHFLDVKGVRGKGIIAKLYAPSMLISAVWQARKVLKTLNPNVVLGMGGFASGPGGIAAWTLGIPIVIHEQNAVFGLTNKWLAKVAKRVLCGFDLRASAMASQSPSNVEFVGNPVRAEFFSTTKTQRHNDTFRFLIVGGSLGALALNQIIPEVINQLRKKYAISVVHQAGKGKAQPVQLQYAQMTHKSQARKSVMGNEPDQKLSKQLASQSDSTVLEFIDDIPAQFAQADIVICRAGALTVAEVAATESCAIFVPLPIAVDDHQTYNARALSDNDAAILIGQDKLADNLYSQLDMLLSNPQKITEMGRKARALCIQDATLKVISAVVQEGLREKL